MRILQRAGTQETLTVEQCIGRDGQGKLTFNSPVDVNGRVVRKIEVVRGKSGEETRTVANIWIDAGQPVLPDVDDRIVTEDGLTGIVVARTDGKALQIPVRLDHVQLKIREE